MSTVSRATTVLPISLPHGVFRCREAFGRIRRGRRRSAGWAMARTRRSTLVSPIPGVRVFDGTVALVHRLRTAGVRTAVFSASRNAAQVLEAAGVGELFRVRTDGLVAERLGLPGKPDPATLVHTAIELDAEPERTVVIEDAEAGVAAGRSGGFGLVIGIDRTGHPERLARAGADIVTGDAGGIRIRGGFRRLSEIADALVCWPSIADGAEDERAAVLLDFDGTISDIMPDPGAAVPIPGVRDTLARLATECPVAVISGRGLDDLRTRVGVDGIWYAGSHGFELLAPDGTRHVHDVGCAIGSGGCRVLAPPPALWGAVVRCSRGNPAATDERKVSDSISTPARDIGIRTPAPGPTMPDWRWPTTCGTTIRPPGTGLSWPNAVPNYSWRSLVSGPIARPMIRSTIAITSEA